MINLKILYNLFFKKNFKRIIEPRTKSTPGGHNSLEISTKSHSNPFCIQSQLKIGSKLVPSGLSLTKVLRIIHPDKERKRTLIQLIQRA